MQKIHAQLEEKKGKVGRSKRKREKANSPSHRKSKKNGKPFQDLQRDLGK